MTAVSKLAAGEHATAATSDPILKLVDVTVDLRRRNGSVPLLTGVSLEASAGTTLGVVGESGSGKSLTALSIMGLLPAGLEVTGGSICFRSRDLRTLDGAAMRAVRGTDIGMIFQDPQNSLNPAFTIGSQIIETLRAHDPGLGKSAARRRAIELLDRVGIPRAESRLGHYPHQFSGGMAQRVMVALAISSSPAVLIADEPTTALDVTVQAQILALLRSIQDELSMTMLLISHDLGVIAQMADNVAVMYAGEVVEHGSVRDVFTRPQHPYTAALLAAQPSSSREPGQLAVIEGTVPEAEARPTGCRFRTRCTFADARCAEHHPQLESRVASQVRCLRADELDLTPPAAAVEVRHTKRSKPRQGAPLLDIQDVTRAFHLRNRLFRRGQPDLVAVANASLQVWPGETLGIVGESGAGKSTLGRLLLGLDRPTSGRVMFDGADIHHASRDDAKRIHRNLSVVFQNPYASLDPSMSIADSVVEPLRAHQRLPRAARLDRAHELLDAVGLPAAYAARRPHELSGGQRQRVAIARALALRPKLVVCDEAVSALDVSTQAQVLNLLADLQREHGIAYVFIGHDLEVVHHLSDRIAVMHHGRVVEVGPADDVYHAPQHPYTQALLGAVLSTDVERRQIKATVETAESVASGSACRFAGRCPSAMERCRAQVPSLRAVGASSVACHLFPDTTPSAPDAIITPVAREPRTQ